MKGIFLAVAMLIAISTVYAQQTVTITATKDNTLYQDAEGTSSNGAGAFLFAGRTNQAANNLRRAVVKFDLTGKLPENAVISRAILKMNVSKTVTGASDVKVHRLLGDWGEGTSDAGTQEGGGAAATTNDATWKHKFFSTQSWVSLGGDFNPLQSAVKSVAGTGSYQWEDTLLWADVLSWYLVPSTNFGWIIIGNEAAQSAKRFDSRSAAAEANRPQLIITYTTSTTVNDGLVTPQIFELKQNYPNPFNPSTTISFSLSRSEQTTIKVYDVLGTEVTTLVNQHLSAGSHSVKFDASNLSGGVYFYRLQSGRHSATQKLMLLK